MKNLGRSDDEKTAQSRVSPLISDPFTSPSLSDRPAQPRSFSRSRATACPPSPRVTKLQINTRHGRQRPHTLKAVNCQHGHSLPKWLAFTLAAPLLGQPNPGAETWNEKLRPAGIRDVRLTFSGLVKGGRGTPGGDKVNSGAGKSGETQRREPGAHVVCDRWLLSGQLKERGGVCAREAGVGKK